jgi:hypothetical protein
MHRNVIRSAWIIAAACWLGLSASRAGEVSSFQAGDGGWQLGTLAVGNLDNSGQLAIVVPYRNSSGQWLLDAYKPNGTRMPGFPYVGNGEINVSPTLYDLDGDGKDEIIFTCGANVIALRGNGSLFWSNQVNRLNYLPNSGYMTVTNGFYWSNGGGFIPNLPTTAVFSSEVSSPMVADVNGDGKKEIVTQWKIDPDSTSDYQDFNPFINDIWGSGEWGTVGESWSGGVVFFDAATGAKQYVYHLVQDVEAGLALGHADTNRPLDTYVLNDSGSVVAFDKTKPFGLYGSGNLIGQFGKNSQVISGSYEIGVDVYTADINGDGLSEVLVPTTHYTSPWQPNETILDHDGAVLWRKWEQQTNFPLNQWQNNACMIPINPDHDNHIDVLSFYHSYEIDFRYWNGVELVDHAGWPKNFYPYLPTPPVVGDVDGDGQEEIIIGTYNPTTPTADGTLYVFALDGTLKFSVPVPGGLKHIPSIANVYGNGLDVVYRSLAGKIYIQNFGSTNSGPVSWATHRGNKQRDGNFGVSLFPPGTPIITSKQSGYRRASFSWSATTNAPLFWQIYRADQPEGPFMHLMTLTPSATSYTDSGLKPGCQYIYEVGAVYPTNTVLSGPFAMLSSLNSNLVANSGFEENSDSHWDKWWGNINWTNMVTTTNVAYQGNKSMQITLINQSGGPSISQYNQYGTPYSALPVTPGTLYSYGGFFKSGGISQPSQHWLQWTSSKTAANTNNRPALPYPYYFTPYFSIGTTNTDWTYANRTFVMPTGFPNVELSHWYSATAAASGSIYLDNIFFRALPSPGATNWTDVIPFGSTWRYNTSMPPANWPAANFDDSGWASGTAKFGAGTGPTNIVTRLPQRLPLYFFRKSFVLPAGCEELLLSATCTDAGYPPDIYLNGTKLVTSGIDIVSNPGNDVRYYDLTPFLNLLQPGSNTIAVALQNTWAVDYDDIAFDMDLKAVAGPAAAVTPQVNISTGTGMGASGSISGFATPISQINLNISVPPNTVWRVESEDSLAGPWQLMDVVTNTAAGVLSLMDTGQNGRLPPSQTPTRFYRMVPN